MIVKLLWNDVYCENHNELGKKVLSTTHFALMKNECKVIRSRDSSLAYYGLKRIFA